MQALGFSTGAVALGDFHRALTELARYDFSAVELSALREHELAPLMEALPSLDLNGYDYVSIHAPSKLTSLSDADLVLNLQPAIDRSWPIVVHPDVMRDLEAWRRVGPNLCIENMDGRKPIGRTVAELNQLFAVLPESSFCFDIGHAFQIDHTMKLARELLQAFAAKLRQVHLSYVKPDFSHHRMTNDVAAEYSKVTALIPAHVPVILETPVTGEEIAAEVTTAAAALPSRRRVVA